MTHRRHRSTPSSSTSSTPSSTSLTPHRRRRHHQRIDINIVDHRHRSLHRRRSSTSSSSPSSPSPSSSSSPFVVDIAFAIIVVHRSSSSSFIVRRGNSMLHTPARRIARNSAKHQRPTPSYINRRHRLQHCIDAFTFERRHCGTIGLSAAAVHRRLLSCILLSLPASAIHRHYRHSPSFERDARRRALRIASFDCRR